jgi:sugar/nucleoside kinase (ribokinase family)
MVVMTPCPQIDLLTIGEILIDFISVGRTEGLREVSTFRRHLGGSPANLALNVSRLGRDAAIVGKIGCGPFGQYLKEGLAQGGVCTDYVVMDSQVRTSIVFVSQTSGTPDFQPRRDSDYKLRPDEIPRAAIVASSIVHTSTWPLSREPSRSAVLEALRAAGRAGKIVSLDPNYRPVVWPDHEEAQAVMREAYRSVTLTKASLDDAHRFFGPGYAPREYVQMFHELGPETVVFTMGKEGSLLSEWGRLIGHLPTREIEIVDATGAGDAFWAGFLVALLDGGSLERCLLFAREVVELKLRTVGALPDNVDRRVLYDRLPDLSTAFRGGDARPGAAL